MSLRFKVGDQVKYIGDTFPYYTNCVAIINKVDDSMVPYRLKPLKTIPNTYTWIWAEADEIVSARITGYTKHLDGRRKPIYS